MINKILRAMHYKKHNGKWNMREIKFDIITVIIAIAVITIYIKYNTP